MIGLEKNSHSEKKFIGLTVVVGPSTTSTVLVAPFILQKPFQIFNFSRFIPPVKKVSYFLCVM